jgi:hypothetical protein
MNKIDNLDKNYEDSYENYVEKNKNYSKNKGRNKSKGKNNKKNKNNNENKSQMEEKEFENKTFFSTELNMLGKKKSSPPK